jgi:hypothetical protein
LRAARARGTAPASRDRVTIVARTIIQIIFLAATVTVIVGAMS